MTFVDAQLGNELCALERLFGDEYYAQRAATAQSTQCTTYYSALDAANVAGDSGCPTANEAVVCAEALLPLANQVFDGCSA